MLAGRNSTISLHQNGGRTRKHRLISSECARCSMSACRLWPSGRPGYGQKAAPIPSRWAAPGVRCWRASRRAGREARHQDAPVLAQAAHRLGHRHRPDRRSKADHDGSGRRRRGWPLARSSIRTRGFVHRRWLQGRACLRDVLLLPKLQHLRGRHLWRKAPGRRGALGTGDTWTLGIPCWNRGFVVRPS